eukprot:scaffold10705_cov100-Isochrysis_galbana.AAC.3
MRRERVGLRRARWRRARSCEGEPAGAAGRRCRLDGVGQRAAGKTINDWRGPSEQRSPDAVGIGQRQCAWAWCGGGPQQSSLERLRAPRDWLDLIVDRQRPQLRMPVAHHAPHLGRAAAGARPTRPTTTRLAARPGTAVADRHGSQKRFT